MAQSSQIQSSSSSAPPNKASIQFTFDDTYIDSWHIVKDSLVKYHIKATFFISEYYSFDSRKISKLLELQSHGFEISYHSVNHIDAIKYLDSNSIQDYLNTEIIPDLTKMKKDGFRVTAFAYPFGLNTKTLDSTLLKHFSKIRDVAESQRRRNIQTLEELYEGISTPQSTSIISGIGIDFNYKVPFHLLQQAMQKTYDENKTITLYAHKIVSENPQAFQVTLQTLIDISQEATRIGLHGKYFSDENNTNN
jgi:peptidoglycan-N-acetylglucosamine deacetylase